MYWHLRYNLYMIYLKHSGISFRWFNWVLRYLSCCQALSSCNHCLCNLVAIFKMNCALDLQTSKIIVQPEGYFKKSKTLFMGSSVWRTDDAFTLIIPNQPREKETNFSLSNTVYHSYFVDGKNTMKKQHTYSLIPLQVHLHHTVP